MSRRALVFGTAAYVALCDPAAAGVRGFLQNLGVLDKPATQFTLEDCQSLSGHDYLRPAVRQQCDTLKAQAEAREAARQKQIAADAAAQAAKAEALRRMQQAQEEARYRVGIVAYTNHFLSNINLHSELQAVPADRFNAVLIDSGLPQRWYMVSLASRCGARSLEWAHVLEMSYTHIVKTMADATSNIGWDRALDQANAATERIWFRFANVDQCYMLQSDSSGAMNALDAWFGAVTQPTTQHP